MNTTVRTLFRLDPDFITPPEVDRFWSKVARLDTGCWEWQGPVNNQGYGRFEVYRTGRRRRYMAHRLSLSMTGVDLSGLSVRHSCDNPPCVRQDHLLTGSQKDNIHDAVERERINVSGLSAYRALRESRVKERIEAGIKRCPTCGRTKSLDDFHVRSASMDGRAHECRACNNARPRPGQLTKRRRIRELTR